MGTGVSLVAFRDVEDVPAALAAAEAALRDIGLVAGEYDPEAVYVAPHGRVLRPAPGVGALTGYGDMLLSMETNGVAFTGPDYFNAYAIGFAEWFDCPACSQRVTEDDYDRFSTQVDALGMSAAHWCEGQRDAKALCVLCDAASHVLEWGMDDPVFLADVAIEFYGWPAFDPLNRADGAWWKIDVITPLEQAVGRPAMISGYKI